jgi:hypothetical protein
MLATVVTICRVLVAALGVLLSSSIALAQDTAAPVEQAETTEETIAAPPEDAQPPSTTAEESAPEEHRPPRRHRTIHGEQILPPTHGTSPAAPEPDPELVEISQPPPPELEWRLRVGVGASASTTGTDVLSLRLTQEIEWMPAVAAPFLFGLTGGEVIGANNLYLAGVRLGGVARFCEDRLVICSGAIAIRAGAVLGGVGGAQFDLGGDGDVRFRFDGVELGLRVGFFLVSGNTYVDALALLGAAF